MKVFDKRVRALILDMDGVLWRGEKLLVDLPVVFNRIRALNFKVCLATNNSSKTRQAYLDKFRSFGVVLSPQQVVNTADATAHYLREIFSEGSSVYVVGERGLGDTLEEYGFDIQSQQEPVAVVAGIDRNLTYEKLRRATLLIRAGARFIGTNPDKSFPAPEGQIPGAGAILAAIQAAADIDPYIIGKPYPALYERALENLGVPAEETLVVGDRLETDIAGGQQIGCPTALVLSGVTDRNALANWPTPPNIVAQGLVEVLNQLDI